MNMLNITVNPVMGYVFFLANNRPYSLWIKKTSVIRAGLARDAPHLSCKAMFSVMVVIIGFK